MTDSSDVERRVANLVDDVRKRAIGRDHEAAHISEDRAHKMALSHIATHGDEASRRLAIEALKTTLVPFERWCG